MKVLAHGASLARSPRLARAAAGLALRGHEVLWLGPGLPALPDAEPGVLRHVDAGLRLARHGAHLVLGGPEPVAVAAVGWLVRARCMLLALDPAAVRRWGPAADVAWASVDPWGIAEEGDGAALQGRPGPVDLGRVGLWPADGPAPAPDAAHLDTEVLERLGERALARHRTRAPRPGVFLDRDGTLVVEHGYNSDPGKVELLPGVARALHELRAAGLPLIVISNQSGVGRGYFPLARVHATMARLRVALRVAGVELDGIYFCPHAPEDACACRKPGTALLERAAGDHVLHLRWSVMVGDKRVDARTGQEAGGHGVLVRTGYGREEEAKLAEAGGGPRPDAVCDDLGAAAAWILARRESVEA
jgi:D-glycero-D-manno-heptose 1,7-bisphosphate phosphatase